MIAVYLQGIYGTAYMSDDTEIDPALLSERPLDFKELVDISVALE